MQRHNQPLLRSAPRKSQFTRTICRAEIYLQLKRHRFAMDVIYQQCFDGVLGKGIVTFFASPVVPNHNTCDSLGVQEQCTNQHCLFPPRMCVPASQLVRYSTVPTRMRQKRLIGHAGQQGTHADDCSALFDVLGNGKHAPVTIGEAKIPAQVERLDVVACAHKQARWLREFAEGALGIAVSYCAMCTCSKICHQCGR